MPSPCHSYPCHQKISKFPALLLQSTLHLKTWKKFLTLFFYFMIPTWNAYSLSREGTYKIKIRLPLHEDYSVYRTQRCIYNTSFQLTGWNGAWVIGDIVVLVAGACHLAISAIPRWINTCTMKPATEAGEATIYSWRENDEKTQDRTINKRPPKFQTHAVE